MPTTVLHKRKRIVTQRFESQQEHLLPIEYAVPVAQAALVITVLE
jgi:hypothetical protein